LGEIYIKIPDELEKRFRHMVIDEYPLGVKDNIRKALIEAIELLLKEKGYQAPQEITKLTPPEPSELEQKLDIEKPEEKEPEKELEHICEACGQPISEGLVEVKDFRTGVVRYFHKPCRDKMIEEEISKETEEGAEAERKETEVETEEEETKPETTETEENETETEPEKRPRGRPRGRPPKEKTKKRDILDELSL